MPRNQTATAFVPKRGRPDAKQVAAIEHAILSTARRMFFDDGYDAVAMEAVAARAGVSKGTLYARHPSKEALFTAVVEDSVRKWSLAASEQDYLLSEDIGERLRHHGHTIAKSLSQPEVQAFQLLLLANRERFPELSGAMYRTGYLYIVRLIAEDIAVAAARDGMPARDPDAIARMFVSAITGWQLQESAARPIPLDELEAMADRTTDLFLAARAGW